MAIDLRKAFPAAFADGGQWDLPDWGGNLVMHPLCMPERLWDAVRHLAATYGVAPDILAGRLTMIGDMHRDEYEQAIELAITQICDGPDACSPEDAIRIDLVLIGLRHVHEYKVR